MKIENNGTGYAITRDDGTVIELTWNEVSLLVNHNLLDTLRSAIESVVDSMEGDSIDTSAYDGGQDAFVDMIFDCFSDDVECEGRIPDDDAIEERILDEAEYYDGVRIEED